MTLTALPAPATTTSTVPAHIVTRLRAETPSLSAEILAAVCRVVPSYAPLVDQNRAQALRAISLNITTFLDRLQMPSHPAPERDEVCRRLGRLQSGQEGGLVRLETALRTGVRISWRRLVRLAERAQVPARIQSLIADELFGYLAEMTALAREGHATAAQSHDLDGARRALLRTLLNDTPDARTLTERAERARWPLPGEVTVLLAEPGAEADVAEFLADLLIQVGGTTTTVVVPGAADLAQCESVASALGARALTVGPTVPTTDAAESLRWARRLARARDSGQLPAGPITRTDDHVLTLLLSEQPLLAACLQSRQLAPFEDLTEARRNRMLRTLRCWLRLRGDVADMAQALGVHPQTVRYRMRLLRELLGSYLDDPEWRIATEVALLGTHLAEE